MVRYHSLVVDPKSLPKELVPIAWASSTDTLSFSGSRASDVRPESEKRSGEVLMGIKHSNRPHYGLQVFA